MAGQAAEPQPLAEVSGLGALEPCLQEDGAAVPARSEWCPPTNRSIPEAEPPSRQIAPQSDATYRPQQLDESPAEEAELPASLSSGRADQKVKARELPGLLEWGSESFVQFG